MILHDAVVAEDHIAAAAPGEIVVSRTAEDDQRQRRGRTIHRIVATAHVQMEGAVLAGIEGHGHVVVAEPGVEHGRGTCAGALMRAVDTHRIVAGAGPYRDPVIKITVRARGLEADASRRQSGNPDFRSRREIRIERPHIGDHDIGVPRRRAFVAHHQLVTSGAGVDVERALDAVEIARQKVDFRVVEQIRGRFRRHVDAVVPVVQRQVGNRARAPYVEYVRTRTKGNVQPIDVVGNAV